MNQESFQFLMSVKMIEYLVEISDEILIYYQGIIVIRATKSGSWAYTYTYYNSLGQIIFQVKRNNYGFKKKASILFQGITPETLCITKNTFKSAEMQFGEKHLKYKTHYFKKDKISFFLDENMIGYGKHSSIIQSGGRIVYKLFFETDDVLLHHVFIIFFTSTSIEYAV